MFKNCSNLYVTEGSGEDLIFTCPSTSGLIDPTTDMFVGTAGSFTGTPQGGQGYYRNEKPVYEGLRFTAEEVGASVTFNMTNYGGTVLSLEYRTRVNSYESEWADYTISKRVDLSLVGDWVEFRNKGSQTIDVNITMTTVPANSAHASCKFYGPSFTIPKKVSVSGSIAYLFDKNGSEEQKLGRFACFRMFKGTKITTAPDLPSKNIGGGCYNEMFAECIELQTTPRILPALNPVSAVISTPTSADMLAGQYRSEGGQYMYFFKLCWKGTRGAYQSMFEGCTNLSNIDLKIACNTVHAKTFKDMFKGCSNLKNHPKFTQKTLNFNTDEKHWDTSYQKTLFLWNNSAQQNNIQYDLPFSIDQLNGGGEVAPKQAPKLGVKNSGIGTTGISTSSITGEHLMADIFYQMFKDCSSLLTPPEKISINVSGSTSLATETYSDIFRSMFENCASLTTPPIFEISPVPGDNKVPAHLFTNCFKGCGSLNLSSTPGEGKTKFFTISNGTATDMFSGCPGDAPASPGTGSYYFSN